MKIGLVIPTLNAGHELGASLDAIMAQTKMPDDILVIDSASDDDTLSVASSYPGVRTMVIRREDFDHGGTRQLALEEVSGDFVLFLTQDAVPADGRYIENLLHPFEDPKVAMVSGRQLPKRDARRYVQLVQEFNYPAESNVRAETDIRKLGIKALFVSDACSAYRRSALDVIGGIPRPCMTNEDMLAAARFLRNGFKVAYEAEARVIHSHSLSLVEQYRRNRLVGSFLAKYSNELSIPSEVGEGFTLAKSVALRLLSEKRLAEAALFGIDCAARVIGNRVGRCLVAGGE